MTDYLKLDLSAIGNTIESADNLIDALMAQKAAASDLRSCLATENDGLWACAATAKLDKTICGLENTLAILTNFNDLQRDYLRGLEERTGAAGEVVVDASHFRYSLDRIRDQIDVIAKQGGWETIAWASLPASLVDIAAVLVQQEKGRVNFEILAQIMREIKPGYVSRLYESVEHLQAILLDSIEPLMVFDDEIASRASKQYEATVYADTKISIFWGDSWKGIESFGKGLAFWGSETLSGIQQLFVPCVAERLVNETAGAFNWLLSQGAVSLGGVFQIDETTYKRMLADIRAGDVARWSFGDNLEYAVYQGIVEGANKNGLAFTLGSLVPEAAIVFVPATKAAQVYKVAVKNGVHNVMGFPNKEAPNGKNVNSILGYDAIKSIRSIADLPMDVQEVYYKYKNHGWQGNFPGSPEMKAGKKWENLDQDLPILDSVGRSITYQEWDLDQKIINEDRTKRRFVTGSDGSAYYTNEHYSEFIKITEGK